MGRKLIAMLVVLPAVLVAAGTAHAIGFYADVPVQYEFTEDCLVDCKQSATGVKAGVLVPGDIGIGLETYTVHVNALTVTFDLLDVSWLLPIPVVNLTLGLGGGNVSQEIAGTEQSGRAAQLWASLGYNIIPLFDLHLGYHVVDATVHDGPITNDFGGRMISFGAAFTF